MLHIPVLRAGKAYESIETVQIVHHATGEPVATVSQANSGMIVRDVSRMDDGILESFAIAELISICNKAAELFMTATLSIGDTRQSFDQYIKDLSATTGMPVGYCGKNAEKVCRVMAEMDRIIGGLTRGFDLSILDRGYGSDTRHHRLETGATQSQETGSTPAQESGATQQPKTSAGQQQELEPPMLSFFREGRVFGAVLPSNSPGVHGLWIPAIALKAPIVLKPGREEPWTPYRIIESLAAAGIPREAFGFYPTDHAGAGELLRSVDRSMLFGGGSTTAPWKDDPHVEIHGPGFSKVILGDDVADDWEQYIDLMESCIAANGGRSCINASAVWTPRHGEKIADALARRLAKVRALPADDPDASIAAFANPAVAESINAVIDNDLRTEGAVDKTHQIRGSGRLVSKGRCAHLLPTIVWCHDREHPLSNREFLFPYASVVECPTSDMLEAIGPTLVVTALTRDDGFKKSLMVSSSIDRLNIGSIPTWQLSWDQPHEGNLFEHLYRQRSFQTEYVA